MEINNQNQKQSAGDNSTAVQIGNMYITTGLTKSDAKQIFDEEFARRLSEVVEQAKEVAIERVTLLENKVLQLIEDKVNKFDAFADPAFIYSLNKAQASACISEKETDFDVLSQLLLHRVQHGEDYYRRLGINKAIEIIGQVSDDALRGLSIYYIMSHVRFNKPNLSDLLQKMESICTNLLDGEKLPTGDAWIQHFDLLSVVKSGNFGIAKMKRFDDYVKNYMNQFFVSGLPENSESLANIKEEFKSKSIPLDLFVSHPLKGGFVMLRVNRENIDELKFVIDTNGAKKKVSLNDEQKKAIINAVNIMGKKETSDNMLSVLLKEWNSHPILRDVRSWWDAIPLGFNLTPVGQALANAYCHGKDSRIPVFYS